MRYLTWPQARELADLHMALALIPVGSFEQHGPHLPLITDTIVAEALVIEAARRIVEPVVVMPAIAGGLSDHHASFPGTVSLPRDVFDGLLRAYISGLERTGIRRMGIVSGHGGNFEFIGQFADSYRENAGGPTVFAFDDLPGFLETAKEAGKLAGLSLVETDIHAGAWETSLVLHLLGEGKVRDFTGVEGYTAQEAGWFEAVYAKGVGALSSSGVLGCPAGATAEAGRVILDALVDSVVRWMIRSFGVSATSTADGVPQ